MTQTESKKKQIIDIWTQSLTFVYEVGDQEITFTIDRRQANEMMNYVVYGIGNYAETSMKHLKQSIKKEQVSWLEQIVLDPENLSLPDDLYQMLQSDLVESGDTLNDWQESSERNQKKISVLLQGTTVTFLFSREKVAFLNEMLIRNSDLGEKGWNLLLDTVKQEDYEYLLERLREESNIALVGRLFLALGAYVKKNKITIKRLKKKSIQSA